MENKKVLIYGAPTLTNGEYVSEVAKVSSTNSYRDNPTKISFSCCGLNGISYLDNKSFNLVYNLLGEDEKTFNMGIVYKSDSFVTETRTVPQSSASIGSNAQDMRWAMWLGAESVEQTKNVIGKNFKFSFDRYVFQRRKNFSASQSDLTYCYVDDVGNIQEFSYLGVQADGKVVYTDKHNLGCYLFVNGNTISLQDKAGNALEFDGKTGQVTKQTFVGDRTLTFERSGQKITKITDSNGAYADFAYTNNKISTITYKTPGMTSFENKKLVFTYSLSAGDDVLTRVDTIWTSSAETKNQKSIYFEYDQGLLVKCYERTDRDYLQITYDDATGELKKIANKAGNQTRQEITFNFADGYATATNDSGKKQVYREYISDCPFTVYTFTDNKLAKTVYSYSSTGYTQTTTVTPKDQPARTSTQSFDYAGRLLNETDCYGTKKTHTYDDFGNVIKTVVSHASESKNIIEQKEYIGGVLVKTETDDFGNVTTYNYKKETANNIDGLVDSVIDPIATTTFGYDVCRRPLSMTNGSSANNFVYANDDLASTSHNTATFNFAYDNFGDVSQVSVGTQTIVSKNTDYANKKQTTTYANGYSQITENDSYDRTNTVKDGNNNVLYTANYDDNASSKLKSAIDNTTGLNYTYTYNDKGDLTGKQVTKNNQPVYNVSYTEDIFGDFDTETYNIQGVSVVNTDTKDKASGRLTGQNTVANGKTFASTFAYDNFGRVSNNTLTNGATSVQHKIEYCTKNQKEKIGAGIHYKLCETTVPKREVSTVGNVDTIFDYVYNQKGQLVSAFSNGREVAYEYDNLDRLVTEINRPLARKYVYVYDNGGNITEKQTYKYNKANPADNGLISRDLYVYGNTNWKDQLTSYKGVAITYDAVGNPLTHNGNTLTWTRGRLLASYGSNTYTYNINGLRTSKTADGIAKEFILDGDRLIAEKWSNNTVIYYVYNANGIAGFVYNGTPYVYQKNIFGDVVAIYDNTGTKVAGYRYNAFGENFIYYQVGTIGELNPFRYRGYYYDSETGLYYLQSRYYDPAMGRFLNADTIDYLEPKVINGINLYAYSLNNPVQYCDPTGHALILGALIGGIFSAVGTLVGQIRSGQKIDWGRVAISGVAGAISAIIPGGMLAQSIIQTGVETGLSAIFYNDPVQGSDVALSIGLNWGLAKGFSKVSSGLSKALNKRMIKGNNYSQWQNSLRKEGYNYSREQTTKIMQTNMSKYNKASRALNYTENGLSSFMSAYTAIQFNI